MSASFEMLRRIAETPVARPMTAHEVIATRLGRKLPPICECTPDVQEAIKKLAMQHIETNLRRTAK